MRQLPHMNELAAKPGVHVVTLYAQVHQLEEVEEIVSKNNIKYPIAMDSFWEAGYEAPVLPHVWVVGVDGKIVFSGRGEYDKAIETELAKVKYPGLGKSAVHKEVEAAAKAFGEGKYAEAYKLAEAIYDDTEDETAEEDANYIMERIDDRLGSLGVRAETAEVMKNYRVAMRCWEELATKYQGLDDSAEAPERLKKLADSKEVQAEIAARRELLKLMMSLDVVFQDVDDTDADKVTAFRKRCLAEYHAFAVKYKGTGAGDSAGDLVKIFEGLLPEETKPEESKPEEKPKEGK
jgi:tetratricopeptide (TPR) repeat protein